MSELPPSAQERLEALLASRYIDGDDENNAILDALIGSFVEVSAKLALIAFGDLDVPPGKALTDPSVAPDWALPHAALYTGAILPGRNATETQGEYIARARDAAVYPFGIKRGTREAIVRAVQPLLTGTKTIIIVDSVGSYDLVVRTITGETPDAAAVQSAIEGSFVSGGKRGAMAAEMRLTYLLSDDPVFAEATRTFTTVTGTATALNVTRADVT